MPDLAPGSRINAGDFPPTVYASDGTSIANISTTTYAAGTPEIGVNFTAPTTGRVKVTVGGGLRNNGANSDRLALAPQVFRGADATGTEVLAPTVTRGISTDGIATAGEYAYSGRTTLLTGLTPGAQHYARVMYVIFGTNATADLAQRDIMIEPAS